MNSMKNEIENFEENWNKTLKSYIDYAKLRQNTGGNHYPINSLPHFSEPIWDEKLQTYWDTGSAWYNHLTPETKGAIKHLYHKANNEKRNGNNFHHNPDIVAAGCSVTTTVGLPHDFSWPEIISYITGKTVNNVSHSGASVAKIIHQIFYHITKYGQPKEIQILLPELNRCWLMEITKNFTGEEYINLREIVYFAEIKNYVKQSPEHGSKIKTYIHESFDGHKTLIPLDMVANESMRAIEHLAMHCDITGTKLKLFSWDASTDDFLNKSNFPHYVTPPQHLLNRPRPKIFGHGWGWPPRIEPLGSKYCCDLQPQNKYQKLMWDEALDGRKDKQHPSYPGLLEQIHIAVIFLNTIIVQHQIERITN
jgi:hypothetical protein